MMYSDFLNATTKKPSMWKRSLDACQHKHSSEIHYVIANTMKGDVRSYTAFCSDCNEMVYCQTGAIVVPWTTDRNRAFTNEVI